MTHNIHNDIAIYLGGKKVAKQHLQTASARNLGVHFLPI